ncbi:hypothetical protein CR956_00620 [Candidatus Saccharibacteria bacterium]|nr:MAG: hypothetical protein CR956_00620 [Candidatus Saccharibacteria bacterium]
MTNKRKTQRKRFGVIHIIVLSFFVLLTLIWLIAGAFMIYRSVLSPNDNKLTEHQTVHNDGNILDSSDEATVSSVYEKVSPSVVSIVTKTKTNSFYYGASTMEGAGTGIIVGADGYVLTNKHVVDGANAIAVVMNSGDVYEDVSILALDPLNDIAFLKIKDAKDLPVANIGDSTTVKIGQRVIAIGNSLGQYQNTVTSGIISGKGRPINTGSGESVERLMDLIQTDAAINPGNSGGPLLNSQGQVIGINTAVAQGAEGIGFAIPVNASKGILKQILDGKKPGRSYMGVRYIPIDTQISKEYKLPVKNGALIYAKSGKSVVKSGPADKAGLTEGDIITKINNIEVGKRGGVSSLVAEYAPGDTIEVAVLRDGKTKLFKVTLGAYGD